MSEPLFRGVGVALVTLFRGHELEVDHEGTATFAASIVERGAASVLVCGTTGQADSLTTGERRGLIEAVVGRVGGDVPVVAGCGAVSGVAVMDEVRNAIGAGADAVLVPPAKDVGDMADFFHRVLDEAQDVPVLAYNIPGRYQEIPEVLLGELPVAGHKDSSGDADRLARSIGAGLRVYTGSSGLLHREGRLGGPGALVGAANAVPELCSKAFEGDEGAQAEIGAAAGALPKGLPPGGSTKMWIARTRTDFPVTTRPSG